MIATMTISTLKKLLSYLRQFKKYSSPLKPYQIQFPLGETEEAQAKGRSEGDIVKNETNFEESVTLSRMGGGCGGF